jgi:ribose transport system ATP-binding protein
MRGISKAFPGVQALSDVSLDIRRGEVHVLVGQNGAGKSTLIKVLYGASRPDAGELLFDGRPVHIHGPADARRLGIAVIFQEFSLVPHLSVAHNLFLGREPGARVPGLVDRRRMFADAGQILTSLGLDIDPRTTVARLGVAQQQVVEIAKALSQNARVLVMDEPTAALSDREVDVLFSRIRALRTSGIGIVYISHRLKEVFEIGDRITVLRDGRVVSTSETSETTSDELVRSMVGREVSTAYRKTFCTSPGPVLLETRRLSSVNGISDISIQVRAGEIVGLAGLVGAGRSEVVRAIFGVDRRTGGEVRTNGESSPGGPMQAVGRGLALVPESRKTEGLALMQSVQDNVLAAGLRKFFPHGLYRPGVTARLARGLVERLAVATPSARRAVRDLSGGNQQKVVIGKWIGAASRVFLFDEPTRGIDVGAKAEIYQLLERLVSEGAAALMISSELPEIVAVCDRAYVMRDKRIVGELSRDDLTEENILALAMHHA